ncbi:MAG: hypothetical protein PVJ56_08800, partial [Desulfobacterales bacterium]
EPRPPTISPKSVISRLFFAFYGMLDILLKYSYKPIAFHLGYLRAETRDVLFGQSPLARGQLDVK